MQEISNNSPSNKILCEGINSLSQIRKYNFISYLSEEEIKNIQSFNLEEKIISKWYEVDPNIKAEEITIYDIKYSHKANIKEQLEEQLSSDLTSVQYLMTIVTRLKKEFAECLRISPDNPNFNINIRGTSKNGDEVMEKLHSNIYHIDIDLNSEEAKILGQGVQVNFAIRASFDLFRAKFDETTLFKNNINTLDNNQNASTFGTYKAAEIEYASYGEIAVFTADSAFHSAPSFKHARLAVFIDYSDISYIEDGINQVSGETPDL